MTDWLGLGKIFPMVESDQFRISIAVLVAHVAHLAAVLTLYRLTLTVFGDGRRKGYAYVTAILHIFSPAGIFLSAPYAEALCAFLSFAGYLFYAKAVAGGHSDQRLPRNLSRLLSGAAFGLATSVRSNGILNGILFLEDAFVIAITVVRTGPTVRSIKSLTSTGLGGVLIGAGLVVPQWVAYGQYCRLDPELGTGSTRPWCQETIPSMYTFVQRHYW